MRFQQRALGLVPVIFVPVVLGGLLATTVNAATSAREAMVLLAESSAVDTKCRHLSEAQHEQLKGYVARAEISFARTHGSRSATRAVRQGEANGANAGCNQDSRDLVIATYEAARDAVKKADSRRASAQRAPRKLAAPAPQARTDTEFRPSTKGLSGYRDLTMAYYVEHRCQHLTYSQAQRFWKAIVKRHDAALRSFGPSVVKRAMNKAIQRAEATGGCGFRTSKLVRTSYAAIRR